MEQQDATQDILIPILKEQDSSQKKHVEAIS